MRQSSVIFAYLLVAYLLFITMKGELPVYINLLRGAGQSTNALGSGGDLGSLGNSVVTGTEQLLSNNPMSSAVAGQVLDVFGW